MTLIRKMLGLLVCLGALGGVTGALAAGDAKPAAQDLFLKGDAKCTSCHDEADSPGVLHLGKTKHGTRSDSRNPTCTSCHGESDRHIKTAESGKKDQLVAPDVTFGAKSKSSAEARDGACVTCHQNDAKRMFWKGSQHQARDVVCSSCHKVHTAQDAVRDKRAQPEVCFSCHKEQRALSEKPSHHPIPEGKMTCSSCHNPHGSAGPKMLVKDSVTGTCYTCHAEKRGPFIHSHQPVTDDCSNCHNPHGTTADAMLKTRPPFLCLGCHDPSSHPGNVPGVAGRVDMSKNASGTVLGATTPIDNINSSGVVGKTQGMSCMNCHTDIHGSNNPMNSTRALRFWR
jgi:DmsE family decaheme c-type cytochrome